MNRNNVEEIKARLPIEDVLGSYIKLEKSGKAFKAKCPFHHEKTPSFFVSPDRGGYYCFGCNAKGDIFSFVEQFEGLDFKGALKVLAERAGVTLVYEEKTDSDKDRLFRIMEDATKYFEQELVKSKTATEYVKKRGITDKTRAEFRIGYAPEGWRNLYTFLQSKKWSNEYIEKAGLAKRGEDRSDNLYDRFRGRIMFPISDSSGRVVAFTGRILVDDGKSAKYLNSPDTPIFDKSSILFGLDKAKSYIRRLDYSILVEGQMDLIMSHQAGVRNTVASSGTALTDSESNKNGVISNLGLLRRLSGNVIIAFDSDAAGRKAAMRASGIALSLGMDVKVADIQGGKDPADLVLNNPEDWKNILRKSTPVVEFELNNVMRDTTEPRKIPKAIRERVLPFIALIESGTDKAHFVKLVADKTNLLEQTVWDDLKIITGKIEAENNAPVAAGMLRPTEKVDKNDRKRLDLVERRLFGLLEVMRKANYAKHNEYREQINKIAGDNLDDIQERIKGNIEDLSFEAETFFGNDDKKWDVHMRDLILSFEEDLISEELVRTMNEIRLKEKAKDQAAVAELAKKCQVLSLRKADIAKVKR